MRSQRCAAFVLVVAAHVLAFMLLSSSRPPFSRPGAPSLPDSEPLQWLDLTQTPAPAPPTSHADPSSSRRTRAHHDANAKPPLPAPLTEAPPDAPSVDWTREAQQAARTTVDEIARRETRKCDDSRDPRQSSPLLRKCTKPSPEFDWSPEPQKAGVIGLLPYVRLGKRCIVGLGFFGCALGQLPEANGHLLDHMNDPDRERSSVPKATE